MEASCGKMDEEVGGNGVDASMRMAGSRAMVAVAVVGKEEVAVICVPWFCAHPRFASSGPLHLKRHSGIGRYSSFRSNCTVFLGFGDVKDCAAIPVGYGLVKFLLCFFLKIFVFASCCRNLLPS